MNIDEKVKEIFQIIESEKITNKKRKDSNKLFIRAGENYRLLIIDKINGKQGDC